LAVAIKKDRPKIIAAIPAYNEAKHIEKVIRNTFLYVDQVYVIDDGSTDRTVELAKTVGAKILKHQNNKGKGAAVNTAFNLARRIRPEILILLDGDNQHNPDDIPNLLEPILRNECDIVVGSRFMRKNKIPTYRILGQSILTYATNFGSGVKLTDSQSGFRAFSYSAVSQMVFNEKGLSIESEMQFLAGEKKLVVKEVPITTTCS